MSKNKKNVGHVSMKFNLDDPRERAKFEHISKQGNKQAYLKDLVSLDMAFNILKGGVTAVPQVLQNEQEKERHVDLSEYDMSDAIDIDF